MLTTGNARSVRRRRRVMPLRVDLEDVTARYVRVNTPAFRAGALTLYGDVR